MATLVNRSKDKTLFTDLKTAESFSERLLGLIGTKELEPHRALLFRNCNWIHTFFMSMPIDVIYLDRSLRVKKIARHLSPWRLPAPVLGAWNVVETKAGSLPADALDLGDQLDVGH